jgi:hypothetical protein
MNEENKNYLYEGVLLQTKLMNKNVFLGHTGNVYTLPYTSTNMH